MKDTNERRNTDRCATCGCERLQHGWGMCVGTVTFGLRDLGERQCSCTRFVSTYKERPA